MIALAAGQPEPQRPTLIGARRRPRVALVGELPAVVAATVAELAPDPPEQVTVAEAAAKRHSEWDVIITAEPLPDTGVSRALHAIVLCDGTSPVDYEMRGDDIEWVIGPRPAPRCTEFHRPGHEPGTFVTPGGFVELAADSLIPYFQDHRHPYWFFGHDGEGPGVDASLARDGDLRPLGIIYRRWLPPPPAPVRLAPARPAVRLGALRVSRDTGGIVIAIPRDVTQLDAWIRHSFRFLATRHPAAFTSLRDWSDDPAWHSTAQREAARQLAVHLEQQAAAEVAREATTDRLRAALEAAAQSTMASIGQLLTAGGDQLAAAVAAALRAIGFRVIDADELPGRAAAKLEDLLVYDPDDPEWVAVVEVRGHVGGAKATDLAKLSRWAATFRDQHDRWPSRRWYVVNQFRNDNPSGRPVPLANNQEGRAFTNHDGLIIDTRALFQTGQLPTSQHTALRARLRQATGTITSLGDLTTCA